MVGDNYPTSNNSMKVFKLHGNGRLKKKRIMVTSDLYDLYGMNIDG